jgi:cardiolipin synthase
MSSRVLTPANQITILRLAFVPVFAILSVGGHHLGALVVLILAALSDAADGLVARRFDQISSLGIALDPIADKVLISTAYLVLSFNGAMPWWLTILVLSRDVGILMIALMISLAAGYRPFPPTRLGKLSTVAQVAAVLVVASAEAKLRFLTPHIMQFWIYLAGALTIVSALHYLVVVRVRYSQHLQDETASIRHD